MTDTASPAQSAQPTSKLTHQQLERHLWAAADILRDKIDAADFKHYIFGLLFFKRLCDVWEEEYEERLKPYQGDLEMAADPGSTDFTFLPMPFGEM